MCRRCMFDTFYLNFQKDEDLSRVYLETVSPYYPPSSRDSLLKQIKGRLLCRGMREKD